MRTTPNAIPTSPSLWLIAHFEILVNITAGFSTLAVDPSAANLTHVAVHVGTLLVELLLDPFLAQRVRRLALRDEQPGRPP